MSRDGELGTEDLAQSGGVRQEERPASMPGDDPAAGGGEGATREGGRHDLGATGERGGRSVGFEGNTATDDTGTGDMGSGGMGSGGMGSGGMGSGGMGSGGMGSGDMATQRMSTQDMPTQDLSGGGAAGQRPGAADAYQDEGMSGAGASATTGDRSRAGAMTGDQQQAGPMTGDRSQAGAMTGDQQQRPGAAAAAGVGGDGDADVSLLDRADQDSFRQRWSDAQARFVDDPRGAVQTADALVAELMQSMAQGFSEHKGRLESQWQRGGDPDTEELRQALQRYRSFFDRLLST
jgi:hypothetical protein